MGKNIMYNDSVSFAERYLVDTSKYTYYSVTELPFSVRVINCLMKNGMTTLSDVLESNPASLMKLKGFGANCLEEINAFCKSLDEERLPDKNTKKICKTSLSFLSKYKDLISSGDFSFVENEQFDKEEKETVDMLKEAQHALGQEFVSECFNNVDKVDLIVKMLTEFYDNNQRRFEVRELLEAVPFYRQNNKMIGYINAFTIDERERNILCQIVGSNDASIKSLLNARDLSNTEHFFLVRKFLKWCAFDLKEEVHHLFDKLYSKDKYQLVIQKRARRKTLEEIGETLGVTRERVRQIESKAKRVFKRLHDEIRIISKISAERNGDPVITFSEISECCEENFLELLYLLQSYESVNYTYDKQLEVFIVGSDSIKERVNNYVEELPDIITEKNLQEILKSAQEVGISIEILEKSIVDNYRKTGEVYHRCRLSLAKIYEKVLEKHYPSGFRAYNPEEIARFRQIIFEEYGDVGLPVSDHALTSRVASICILCGKGVYRLKNKDYLPRQLANKICDYIENNENTIFLTNTLFSIFEDELLSAGIDNKYFLQGVLHELFADKFVFRRDYISKDTDVTSVYSAVVGFINKSNFPVSKAQIQEAFPGITEIVINLSVSDHSVLNYFGEYLHASKLNILETEKNYLLNVVENLVADGEAHHGKELYEVIFAENPEILTRNAAMSPFSVFSIIEFLFRDKFQFSRPFFAMNGIEIDRPAERLHDLIYSSNKFTVTGISEFGRENHFQIYSLLEYVNDCNDEFLLIDDDTMMKIELTGIDENIAGQVETIILNSITETTPVKDLSVWPKLPTINIPWTEWLIYSVIFKWGTKLLSATSSNQFRLSVPLVAPVNNYDPTAFKNIEKSDNSYSFVADDLSNMDSLLEDIIDFNVLGDNQ